MAMTLRLPADIETQLKEAADAEHRSVQATVLIAVEDYLAARDDPVAGDLAALEDTVFWLGVEIGRLRAGEPGLADEAGQGPYTSAAEISEIIAARLRGGAA